MNSVAQSNGTQIDEITEGLFRVHTPVSLIPGGFSFNQYLIRDEQSLLFHTGPRSLFPQIRDAIATVLPLERLHYIGFSHVESDECGSLNQFLAVAPCARPLCSQIAAMVSITDLADSAPVSLADNEVMSLGRQSVRWIDAPHVPHGWENGFLMVDGIQALLCGDLFTQPGAVHPPIIEGDILGPIDPARITIEFNV